MRYLRCKETAKLLRVRLKKEFPGTKFSVRSDVYAGGASIRVEYTDGPALKDVEAVCNEYNGSGFDGMIDMKIHYQHYILPDGQVCLYKSPGTVGSGGYKDKIDNELPEGAEAVSFGADYVFVNKNNTVKRIVSAIKWIEKKYPETKGLFGIYENPDDKTGSICNRRWLDNQGHSHEAREINNELYEIVNQNKPSAIGPIRINN